jgi:hypothetical protein
MTGMLRRSAGRGQRPAQDAPGRCVGGGPPEEPCHPPAHGHFLELGPLGRAKALSPPLAGLLARDPSAGK